MQKGQEHHDKTAHSDVLQWALDKRLRHYFLHFGKYWWALELAKREERLPSAAIITDAMIIVLAAANALDIDLEQHAHGQTPEHESIEQSFAHLHEELLQSIVPLFKAFEGFDHEEPIELITVMRTATIRIAHAVLQYVEVCNINLPYIIALRWRQIERKVMG